MKNILLVMVLLLASCGKSPQDQKSSPRPPVAIAQNQIASLSRPSGCQNDIQCKGDRVCEKGVCVAPHLPTPHAARAAPPVDDIVWGRGGMQDGDGSLYRVGHNKHGAVLKSKNKVLYLGNNCDASGGSLGKGTWGWANGGVMVELKSARIGFPRQESPFEDSRCQL